MIEANFLPRQTRMSAVSGAYQYDMGQRLRLHGLPDPGTIAALDETLSPEMPVSVSVQYGYSDEDTSESRPAVWNESDRCWLAEVPDRYLRVSEPVYLFVVALYGADETHARSKTLFEGRFTPISRPAPSDTVTPDEKSAWDALQTEVTLALSRTDTARSRAEGTAAEAREAAESARTAGENAARYATEATEAAEAARSAAAAGTAAAADARAAEEALSNLGVEALSVPAGEAASAEMTQGEDGKVLRLCIPRGREQAVNLLSGADFSRAASDFLSHWQMSSAYLSVTAVPGGIRLINTAPEPGLVPSAFQTTGHLVPAENWGYTLMLWDTENRLSSARFEGPGRVTMPLGEGGADAPNFSASLEETRGHLTLRLHVRREETVTVRRLALIEGLYEPSELPLCGAVSETGTIREAVLPSFTTRAATHENPLSLTLPAGVWLLTAGIAGYQPVSSASNDANITILDSPDYAVSAIVCGNQLYNQNGYARVISCSAAVSPEAETTYYLSTYTRTAYRAERLSLRAVRIA